MTPIGLNPDGTLRAPQPGPDYDKAAWFVGSATPGQIGPSVIEGHLDSHTGRPMLFWRLGDLRPGDTINVTRRDGRTAVFAVTGVKQYPKTSFPTQRVYRSIHHAGLRLITCGGDFTHAGHHENNLLVFADMIRSHH